MTDNMIPQNILESLKEFKEHRDNVPCLECGYKGLMGVKDYTFKPFLSTALAFGMVIFAALFGLYGIILSPAVFGASWALFLIKTSKQILTCPNCKTDLPVQ